MDNFRFIQVLQELINSQNSSVLALNNFLQEAQNSNYASYSEAEYNSLQNTNTNLQNQIGELNNTVNNLQNSYQSLLEQFNSGTSSTNSQIEALQGLVSALGLEKDSLTQQLQNKDEQISSLNSRLEEANSTSSSFGESASRYQNQIFELNNKLTECLNQIDTKNKELLILENTVTTLKQALLKAKITVAAELDEAKSDIDRVLEAFEAEDKNGNKSYTAVFFNEITRYLAGEAVSLEESLCKAVLYQDKELTAPSPNEGSLTLNGNIYATDGNGIIRLAGTTCE